MEMKIKCPQCGKEHIKKDGQRKTENRGFIQRYKCKDCGHRFVIDDGFFRMGNTPWKR
jgi:transposase-like protein